MLRQVEPELMIDNQQCKAYADSPGAEGLRAFFMETLANFKIPNGTIVDLGCGPAILDVQICQSYDVTIDAYDGSDAMMDIAKDNISKAGLTNRIKLNKSDITNVSGKYNWVMSNNVLHHMHNPIKFWNTVKSLTTDTSQIFIIDILRPETEEDLEKIINFTTEGEDLLVVTDFINSLRSAFTVEEIKDQLKDIFPTARVTKLRMEKISHIPFDIVSITF